MSGVFFQHPMDYKLKKGVIETSFKTRSQIQLKLLFYIGTVEIEKFIIWSGCFFYYRLQITLPSPYWDTSLRLLKDLFVWERVKWEPFCRSRFVCNFICKIKIISVSYGMYVIWSNSSHRNCENILGISLL